MDNVEDFLEHVQGNLLSGKIEANKYRASKQYGIIKMDLELLETNGDDESKMLLLRNNAIRKIK